MQLGRAPREARRLVPQEALGFKRRGAVVTLSFDSHTPRLEFVQVLQG